MTPVQWREATDRDNPEPDCVELAVGVTEPLGAQA